MIPVEEHLINFKSHEDTAVMWEGLDMVVIVGDNGSGKTTLIEAVTYALFGKTPPTENREITDDQLIKLGETEMSVTYHFTHRQQNYRIVRKKSGIKGKTSTATLSQYHEGKWNPIAEGKAVTPRVEQILGQDYESFTSTSMIMQNRGERLLVLQPRERFRLLFDLFGYTNYPEYEKKARSQKEQRATKRETAEELVAKYLTEAANQPDHEKALADAQEEMNVLVPDISAKKEQIRSGYEETATLKADIKHLLDTEDQHKKYLKDASDTKEKQGELLVFEPPANIAHKALALYDKFSGTGGTEKAIEAKTHAASTMKEARKAADETGTTRKKIAAAQKRIDGLTARINELKSLTLQSKEITESSSKMASLDGEIARLRTELEALRKEIASLNSKLQEAKDLKAEKTRLAGQVQAAETQRKADVKAVEEEIAKAKEGTASLQDATCHGEGIYAACPLIATAVKQRDSLPVLKERLESARKRPEYPEDADLKAVDEKLKEYQTDAISSRIKQATSEEQKAIETLKKKEGERKTLEGIAMLATSLATAESDITTAEGDIDRFRTEIREHEARVKQLQSLEESIPSLEEEVSTLEAVIAQLDRKAQAEALTATIEGLTAKANELLAKIAQLPAKRERLQAIAKETATAEEQLAALEKRQTTLVGTTVTERNAIEQCKKAANAADEKGKEISALEYEEKLYSTIEEACRRIPYIMLENILPQIEYETNEILARISDTDMRVEMSTRKADSSSVVKDTLDIRVYDNAGERDVKLYSPGERTRLALALTIGIAETTAKRAGIVIETLAIDEPSNLDEKGFHLFGQCVQQLAQGSGRIKKVIVITHSPILRDMFSQRIEVAKSGANSIIEIIK